ncbi:MAG: glutamyl-tRNA amidotransferase [Gammaproteobacteria bacterium CG_4_10_14_0_8_um_filter_38_16]|nr:MAG: glutamyl-tRNA amidotransferase [Gammaproteobacteria bacterium CG_4_10_14_0_8_um_filter_38_16]PJA02708.1 MAG: glutamyl-tRNA amidotransferase [Gammaproteobacteria bacterium CG_4_10_14_0_2_um_filter_38_22]PJB09786.1 MAG: glutamyl-tRNA amidotransferase [Gammaproteobacteria bacterium CG_4_9_14_3_um_filter_38_9]
MADSALKKRILEDMKSAMRAKETSRLGTIRMLLAAIKQREVDERIELSDSDVLSILNKMIKQRRESATQFHDAKRPELAEKEEQEITQLNAYLPEQMNDHEIDKLIEDAIKKSGAVMVKEMGSVMAIIKPKAQGRADMGKISEKIKSKLK